MTISLPGSASPKKRKLAAILVADVVSYSKLVGEDEEGTLTKFHSYADIVDQIITHHEGRIFNRAGDELLAEFSSPVQGVRAAIEIQVEIGRRNKAVPQSHQIHFRVGVHLGDVVLDGDNIEGDGVNIASRLQCQAEPDGVFISIDTYRQIRGKMNASFELVGRRKLKNIAEPMSVYRALPGAPRPIYRQLVQRLFKSRLRVGFFLIFAVAIAVLPRYFWNRDRANEPSIEVPSIAVLPLKSLPPNLPEDYFGDGLTTDITGELSRFKNLFVIASNSAFAYKNTAAKAQSIGADLGVRYLLQGTYQKGSDRVRLSAELIDATTGRQIWFDRYDRKGSDFSQIQDDLIDTVVARLAVQVESAEKERARQNPTSSLEAYDHYLKGRQLFSEYTKEDNAKAIEEFQAAVKLDPSFARAHSWLGYAVLENYKSNWGDPQDSLELAKAEIHDGVKLGRDDYYTHWTLATFYMEVKDMEGAHREYEIALGLNSNDADLLAGFGDLLSFEGKPSEAIAQIERAKKLNPIFPEWYYWSLALAQFQAREYEEAVKTLESMSSLPNEAYLMLVISKAKLGKPIPLHEVIAQLKTVDPDWTTEHLDRMPFAKPEDHAHWQQGLRLAGLIK